MDDHNERRLAEAIMLLAETTGLLTQELCTARRERNCALATKADLANVLQTILLAMDSGGISAEDQATLTGLLAQSKDWTEKLELLAGQSAVK